MAQLIQAFNRTPQRPSPNYADRAYSDGGNAVGYGATMEPAPAQRAEDHRERVLLELAALTHAPAAGAPGLNEGRDVTTAQPARHRRARRTMWLAAGGAAAVAVLGIAAVHAGAPPLPSSSPRASGVPPPMGPPEAPTAAIALRPLPEAVPVLSPMPTTAPSARSTFAAASQAVPSHPAQTLPVARRASGASASPPSPPPSARPANDPTLDELDRAP
jgi:hypothetical protein